MLDNFKCQEKHMLIDILYLLSTVIFTCIVFYMASVQVAPPLYGVFFGIVLVSSGVFRILKYPITAICLSLFCILASFMLIPQLYTFFRFIADNNIIYVLDIRTNVILFIIFFLAFISLYTSPKFRKKKRICFALLVYLFIVLLSMLTGVWLYKVHFLPLLVEWFKKQLRVLQNHNRKSWWLRITGQIEIIRTSAGSRRWFRREPPLMIYK